MNIYAEKPTYSAPLPLANILRATGSSKFEAGKRYWLNLVHEEDPVLTWQYAQTETPTVIWTNKKLINAVESNKSIVFHKNANGFVDLSDIYNYSIITGIIDLNVNNSEISSLEGIEYFTSLETLNCDNNNLTTIDISQNKFVKSLYCNNNQLTEINVSNNHLLELSCENNNISSLDLSQTELNKINCRNNKLTALDLKHQGSTCYYEIICNGNHIPSLDISTFEKWSFEYDSYILLCGQQTDIYGIPSSMYLTIRLEDRGYNKPSQILLWETNKDNPQNSGVIVDGYGDNATGPNFGNGGKF